MRSDSSRLLATLVVWGSFTSLFIFLFFALAWTGADVTMVLAFFMLVMFLAMLAGVIRATEAIWASIPVEDSAKAKRAQSSRVRRLVDSLEDDEIYELEELLLARDDQERAKYGSR